MPIYPRLEKARAGKGKARLSSRLDKNRLVSSLFKIPLSGTERWSGTREVARSPWRIQNHPIDKIESTVSADVQPKS